MRVVKGYPPNFAAIVKAFPYVAGRTTIFFAWGDRVFCPVGGKALYDLVAHEQTHFRQQAACGGPEAWWKRYLAEPEFRLEQEVEAYRNQYRAMSKVDKVREIRRIAGDLSGPMYGGLVSFEEAKRLIRGEIEVGQIGQIGAGNTRALPEREYSFGAV